MNRAAGLPGKVITGTASFSQAKVSVRRCNGVCLYRLSKCKPSSINSSSFLQCQARPEGFFKMCRKLHRLCRPSCTPRSLKWKFKIAAGICPGLLLPRPIWMDQFCCSIHSKYPTEGLIDDSLNISQLSMVTARNPGCWSLPVKWSSNTPRFL